MKYSNTIVTPPVRTDETTEVPIGGYGDSLFISLDYDIPKTLHLPEPDKVGTTRFPSVYIEEVGKGIGAVHKLGEDLVFTVKTSQPVLADTTVDYTITTATFPDVGLRASDRVHAFVDTSDYTRFFGQTDTTLITTLTPTVTILAGTDSTVVTIPTTANTTMLYGEGSYFASQVTLSNISDPQMMIHFDLGDSYLLSEDAISYPVWNGVEIEVWGKLPHVSYYQPVIDPDTSTTVSFVFDFETADDGLGNITITDTLLRSKIIDDIPLESLQFRPVDGNSPLDIENVGAEIDLTTQLPFYTIKVTTGRRD